MNEFKDAPRIAREKRDAGLRRARDEGWRPTDIERVTKMSREAVRQALSDDAREAARKATAERRASAAGS